MSWGLERAVEREEEALQEAYDRGDMTDKELSDAIRELHRDARAQREQEAWEAYDEVMSR